MIPYTISLSLTEVADSPTNAAMNPAQDTNVTAFRRYPSFTRRAVSPSEAHDEVDADRDAVAERADEGQISGVGLDSGEPVTGDYPGEHPHTFTGGTIKRVAVDVSGEPYVDLEREAQAMLARE